jgi:hypothetical protein
MFIQKIKSKDGYYYYSAESYSDGAYCQQCNIKVPWKNAVKGVDSKLVCPSCYEPLKKIWKIRYLEPFGQELPAFYKPKLLKGRCEDYLRDMGPESVDLIIDDPPYGLTRLPWDEDPQGRGARGDHL